MPVVLTVVPMASAELSLRVEKVVGYAPLCDMDEGQRRDSTRRCSRPTFEGPAG